MQEVYDDLPFSNKIFHNANTTMKVLVIYAGVDFMYLSGAVMTDHSRRNERNCKTVGCVFIETNGNLG